MHTPTLDTVIVGGGLAGLAAAAELARSGREVLVLERNPTLGGRAQSDDLDGFIFNRGAHALYNNGPGHRALRSLGVDPAGAAPPLAGGRAAINGGTELLPYGPATLLRTRLLSPASKLKMAKLLGGLARVDATAHRDQSIAEWVGEYPADLRQLLLALSRLVTYNADATRQSAEAAIVQLQGSDDGVLYLHGGWQHMVADLEQVVTEHGGAVRRGVSVTSIDAPSSGFRVVCADAEAPDIECRTVIVAAGGPQHMASLFGLDATVFGDVGSPVEAAVLDLALDSMPEHRFVLGIDTPSYFSVHSPPADLAPPGRVAAVAMRYLDADDEGDAEHHRDALTQLATLAGAPAATRSRFLRRMTVTHGAPLASAGGFSGRPDIDVLAIDGAFVAGDWIGTTGLLADAAICSGVAAARAAANHVRATTTTVDA